VISQLLAPWRRNLTWRSLGHLVLGMLVGGPVFGAMVALLAVSVGLLIVFPLAIPVIWLLFTVSHLLATLERSRCAALLDVGMIDPVPISKETSWWRRFLEKIRSSARWREIAYLLLLFPLGLFTGLVAVGTWTASLALTALPFFVERLPEGNADLWLFDVGPGAGAVLASVVGVIGLVVLAPWVTVALAALCRQVGSWLLSTDPTEALEGRVSALETSRTAAVDSAEAERRRIERDLHDGAQQRLVALAMDLGSAKERLRDEPPEVRELVDAAHTEVKAVIKELRDLVRGIHPVILEDRGLDAALSAVVARFPIPVTLQVDVARRPPATVESTAYFVVSEALTNVVRHAEATEAAVAIARRGDRLVVEVRDNGIGGADPARGSGLSGLADRAASVGGWIEVVSPPGGPTTLIVELPCGS
jgi:signal transduction histidine kinase